MKIGTREAQFRYTYKPSVQHEHKLLHHSPGSTVVDTKPEPITLQRLKRHGLIAIRSLNTTRDSSALALDTNRPAGLALPVAAHSYTVDRSTIHMIVLCKGIPSSLASAALDPAMKPMTWFMVPHCFIMHLDSP